MDGPTLGFLAAASLAASFIDSQVGGGGVISLPALLVAGVPPHVALGTNKLAGTVSSLTATVHYARSGLVQVRPAAWLMPLSFLGALLGVTLALRTPSQRFQPIVLGVMAVMTVYVLVKPRFGADDRVVGTGWLRSAGMAVCALAVGVYDGFLGPGTGSFLLFFVVEILGYGFRRGAGLGRLLNFTSNAAAVAMFLAFAQIDWQAGLVMTAAMLVGSQAGAHLVVRHGDRYLKPLYVAITGMLMVRSAWQAWG